MFSGIIEAVGSVKNITTEGTNKTFTIRNPYGAEALKIDQSIAHNGVCLTVTAIHNDSYEVVAIAETLDVSNIGKLKVDDIVNLERCIKLNDRLDGHIVQGHVDETAVCRNIQNEDGSWYFTFELQDTSQSHLVVPKGSITVNGTSLTVVQPTQKTFKVAIIPYTYEHTNFKTINIGDTVNIEFDIIGKYVQRHLAFRG